jgi:5-methylthioadenosine/S-adenosylhomocysteine deaminase
MATREGARALGLEHEIGSIEPGKRADVIVVDRTRLHTAPDADPWSTLVYASRGSDVRCAIVDGAVLVEGGHLVREDAQLIAADARAAATTLAARARVGSAL